MDAVTVPEWYATIHQALDQGWAWKAFDGVRHAGAIAALESLAREAQEAEAGGGVKFRKPKQPTLAAEMEALVLSSQAAIDAQNAALTSSYHQLRRDEGCVRVPITVNGVHGAYETHTFARPIDQYVQGGPTLGGTTTRGWAVEAPPLREGDSFTVTWRPE